MTARPTKADHQRQIKGDMYTNHTRKTSFFHAHSTGSAQLKEGVQHALLARRKPFTVASIEPIPIISKGKRAKTFLDLNIDIGETERRRSSFKADADQHRFKSR